MLLLILLAFVCIAGALAWFLISQDHGKKEPILALWFAFGMGALGALAAYYIETKFISANNLAVGTSKGLLLGTTMKVAVIEESCKFLPLALLLYKRRFFNEHIDGVIYFALAGLGFGLPENIIYTLQGGTQAGVTRLFLTPIFHAAITGMVGYFLAKQKVSKRSVLLVIVPFACAILLHGVYDFGLLSGVMAYSVVSIAITLCLTGNLFLLFFRATARDQALGLSVVGHNSYCRSCGWPNPRHHLYCVHCGKNA
jgi:RsiW-degrading membrane proteinase PrsW (M82 family)